MDSTDGVETSVLHRNRIPIERVWRVSMEIHDALGHTESWEICEEGCDMLAVRVVGLLFGDD